MGAKLFQRTARSPLEKLRTHIFLSGENSATICFARAAVSLTETWGACANAYQAAATAKQKVADFLKIILAPQLCRDSFVLRMSAQYPSIIPLTISNCPVLMKIDILRMDSPISDHTKHER